MSADTQFLSSLLNDVGACKAELEQTRRISDEIHTLTNPKLREICEGYLRDREKSLDTMLQGVIDGISGQIDSIKIDSRPVYFDIITQNGQVQSRIYSPEIELKDGMMYPAGDFSSGSYKLTVIRSYTYDNKIVYENPALTDKCESYTEIYKKLLNKTQKMVYGNTGVFTKLNDAATDNPGESAYEIYQKFFGCGEDDLSGVEVLPKEFEEYVVDKSCEKVQTQKDDAKNSEKDIISILPDSAVQNKEKPKAKRRRKAAVSKRRSKK